MCLLAVFPVDRHIILRVRLLRLRMILRIVLRVVLRIFLCVILIVILHLVLFLILHCKLPFLSELQAFPCKDSISN